MEAGFSGQSMEADIPHRVIHQDYAELFPRSGLESWEPVAQILSGWLDLP